MNCQFLHVALILITTLIIVANCDTQMLKCVNCNSYYPSCGERATFDATLQESSYCTGLCVKIVVKPGTFIVRTCTSLLFNYNLTGLENSSPTAQQCYLSTYTDPSFVLAANTPAYYCFCNDQDGCNTSSRLIDDISFKFMFLLIFFFLFACDLYY